MTEWGPIGREVYERTYSRTKEDGTKEQWLDTVHRVVEGNAALVPGLPVPAEEKSALKALMAGHKVIPAGRHLWVSGVPGRQYLFNCHRAGWTNKWSDHFCFTFDELMKGGGVGANYSNEYLSIGGKIRQVPDLRIACDVAHPNFDEVQPDILSRAAYDAHIFHVPDSREGWVGALRFMIDSAQYGLFDQIVIDVSDVRGRGEPIRGFGGTASGPGPLVDALSAIWAVLCKVEGKRMTSLDAMEIDHHIARCVISGNVRRSARMSIKHWRDADVMAFIKCKLDYTLHWTTNISVEIDNEFLRLVDSRDPNAMMIFNAVTDSAAVNGEPGFFNSELASDGERGDVRCTNPCGEIALEEWENCNLGHLNLARLTQDELPEAARLMARFLIRATFGNIESELQRDVVDRNRRIGVGIFGFQEWIIKEFGVRYSQAAEVFGPGERLAQLHGHVLRAAQEYAKELGIAAPVKYTTVAPTGSIAKMPGNSEGIHPIYAKHFIRNVRYAADDPLLAQFPAHVVNDCIYSDNTKVVSFVCRDQIYDEVPEELHHLIEAVDDIPIAKMLAVQAMVQTAWADNAVSFTVNFDPDRLSTNELRTALVRYLPRLKGTTVMPDGSRPQAPFIRITEAEWAATEETSADASYDDCANGACPIK